MVHQLTPAVQWRCCRKNGNYPYNHTVKPCHSLVRKNCALQRWFNYPNTSVESDKAHIQGRSSSSRSSRDIYFKFNKVFRSVISRVIMRGRYESSSTKQVANLTRKAVSYCFSFNSQIAHMRIFRSKHFKNALQLGRMGNFRPPQIEAKFYVCSTTPSGR